MFMRHFFMLTACGLVGVGPNGDDAVKKDQQKLQGTWQVIAASENGEKVPQEDIKNLQIIFAGSAVSVREGDKVQERFTFKLDPSKKPKAINFIKKDHTDLGIYLLKDDSLKLCVRAKGGDRPTEFASKPGSKIFFIELKRIKN